MNAKEVSEALGDVNEQFIAEAITYKRKKLPLWFPIAAVAACLCLLIGLLPPELGSLGYAPTMGLPTGPADGYGSFYFREGIPIEGLVIGGDYDSVTVQDLQVTLDLNGSPVDPEAVVCKSTLEYTFHNPTDKPITLNLTLPCGQNPWYETETDWFSANRHLYTASVNGEPLDLTLRLTGDDTPPTAEGNWSIGLFSDHTPVTIFTYEVETLDSGDSGYITIWNPGGIEAVVLLDGYWRGAVINGNTEKSHTVSRGSIITLYVFGDAADFNPGWQFYTDYTMEQSTTGTIDLISTSEMTFQEYAAQSWDSASGASLSDWACAMAHQMHRASLYSMGSLAPLEDAVYRWFQYDLTLEPGETVVNTVTMPLYPGVSFGSRQQQFRCHFDILSMRKPPVQHGPVITVNTPYELTESSLECTETDTGYTLDLTDVREIQLSMKLGEPVPDTPPEPAPAPESPEQVHWLTILGGSVLAVLGLYWLLRRRTE